MFDLSIEAVIESILIVTLAKFLYEPLVLFVRDKIVWRTAGKIRNGIKFKELFNRIDVLDVIENYSPLKERLSKALDDIGAPELGKREFNSLLNEVYVKYDPDKAIKNGRKYLKSLTPPEMEDLLNKYSDIEINYK